MCLNDVFQFLFLVYKVNIYWVNMMNISVNYVKNPWMVGFQTIFQQLQTPEVWSRHCGSLRSIGRENSLFLVRCNNDKTVGILIIQSWRLSASAQKKTNPHPFSKGVWEKHPMVRENHTGWSWRYIFFRNYDRPGNQDAHAMDPPRYASPKEQPTRPQPSFSLSFYLPSK